MKQPRMFKKLVIKKKNITIVHFHLLQFKIGILKFQLNDVRNCTNLNIPMFLGCCTGFVTSFI